MITTNDQEALFNLIAKSLQKDVLCYAFGGNAMMYYGYKGETKDVDLLFLTEDERQEFVRIIKLLGYDEYSLVRMYVPEKLRTPGKPIVFRAAEGRFDLFLQRIFQTLLSPAMKKDTFALHEYREKHLLTVHVLRKEHLVLLKAVTDRENDFRDIRTITQNDKSFDWQYLLDEVKWQYQHGDGWVLLDVEKMMKELQEYVFIPEKYMKQLYGLGKALKKNKLKKLVY